MDNFFQQFKDNLENQPAPKFDRQDWADMRQRLEQHHNDSSKPINYWTWASVALLLIMIGSNSLILEKLGKANEQINHLESAIDTLIQTKIIFRTDTIYQFVNSQTLTNYSSDMPQNNEIITKKNIPQKRNFANLSTSHHSFLSPFIFYNDVQPTHSTSPFPENYSFESIGLQKAPTKLFTNFPKNIFSFWQQKTLANNTTDAPEKKEELTANDSLLSPIEVKSFSSLNSANASLPVLYKLSTTSVKQKKSFLQILYPMCPKGIEVGLSYGLGMSLAEHHRRQDMQQWEIATQIKFSQPIRLWLAGNYNSLSYESIKMGEQYGVPELAPPSDDFEFDEAHVQQRIMSFLVGLQYDFRASKKWQPFIGIGYGFSNITNNSIRYRFEVFGTPNPSTVGFETVTYDNANNLPFGLVKSGIEYQLNDKLSFQLEGRYLHRIKNHNNQLPNILTVKLGTSFSF